MSFLPPRWFALLTLIFLCAAAHADVVLTSQGTPQAVILTKPSPLSSVLLAAQELQQHLQRMSGATLPIDVVGTEASYPGRAFIYVGSSTATSAAGINLNALELEYYTVRTIGSNLFIVGRDGGDDVWWNLTDCQPGTLFGVYHLLGDILGVRWLWPGESGRSVPRRPTVSVPTISVTTGPALVQRKYRTPRVGTYLGGGTTYGFGVPVLPASATRKQELAYEDLLWLRRMRMGSRKKPAFAHYFTNWWTLYGATHPEYFAVLPAGKTHPHPAADRIKQHVSGPAVWQQRLDEWTAAGGSSVNICPTDSRSFCVCATCLSWDRPAQSPDVIFSDSNARLSDRYARFYSEIATRVKAINPAATVYGYAYDVYRHYPLEATVPDNVALAYVPGAPSAVLPSSIAETEEDVLGWIAKGCTQMYLRPNWMLSGHCGPFWPTRRLGNHLRTMLLSGNIKGFDSDSSCSSYAGFGLYYYLVCRLIADPTLTPDAILDEYCSAFGPAAARVRDYFNYWEFFINNQADSANTNILAWSECVPAYGSTYADWVFEGALQLLDAAYANLGPSDAEIRARLDFLRLGCTHGRLTAKAISRVDPALTLANNRPAEIAMRQLLAFRDQNAESHAIWREWMIDREANVDGMESYWTQILATPGGTDGSNVGAFISAGGAVTIEAENYSAIHPGTSTAAGATWQTASFTGAVGSCMQALPNTGVFTNNSAIGPRLDYRIDFRAAGTYNVWVRLPFTNTSDDAVSVGLNGTMVCANIPNTAGSMRWRITNANSQNCVINITTPGVHTLNIWMCDDGCLIDRIHINTGVLPFLTTDPGSAESGKRGVGTEHALTVIGGTGDGIFGTDSLVPIIAAAPKAGYVFDRWIGAAAGYFLSATSASTYFNMTPQDARITATYKVDPAADLDNDGLPDSWERANFNNSTIAANALSDSDGDGSNDVAEFQAGTDPRDSRSRLEVASVTPSSPGKVTLQWRGVAGKSYTILAKSDLAEITWLPIAIAIPGAAPVTSYELPVTEPARFFRIQQE